MGVPSWVFGNSEQGSSASAALCISSGEVSTSHKAQGDRLDFDHLFKAYRDQFPFLVGGSDEDPFEHRQVDLAGSDWAISASRLSACPVVTSPRMNNRKPSRL
jgi:hypothetical protein